MCTQIYYELKFHNSQILIFRETVRLRRNTSLNEEHQSFGINILLAFLWNTHKIILLVGHQPEVLGRFITFKNQSVFPLEARQVFLVLVTNLHITNRIVLENHVGTKI